MKRRDDIHRLKTRPFTAETLKEFRVKQALRAEIDRSRRLARKDISSFRIFDVGCGAAQTIAYLRALGYDAWGGEASPQQFDLARQGLEGIGLDPSVVVLLDLSSGKYPVSDRSFDFVYSDNVLEHVENLESFVQEVDRLTRTGGRGIHIFPSRLKLIEAHVRMPFVHWTLNSSVRLALIRLSIAMGMDPLWKKTETMCPREAAKTYLQYLNDHTFYRPLSEIRLAFRRVGLGCDTRPTRDTIAQKPFLAPLFRIPVLPKLAEYLSVRFHTTILRTEKINNQPNNKA
ncbi:MAG: class I SAM-dependent methyltransferase [Candidatus Poribacteria bacterium]|nr:class I SAM-dependent methyltransferase [Candidatus Poribacteria bacterium]